MKLVGAMLLVLALGLPAVARQDENGQKVELRWAFAKGQILHYEMASSFKTELTGGPSLQQSSLFGMKQEVIEVSDDKTATIKITYERIKLEIAGEAETKYDSAKNAKPPENDLARLMSAFLKKSFTLKMKPDGKVVAVSGMKELIEKIIEDASAGDEIFIEFMGDMLKEMYGDNQMKQIMQLSYGMLPAEKVGKGSTWESRHNYDVPMMGTLQMKNNFKLTELTEGGKRAAIEQKTETEFEQKGDGEVPPINLHDSSSTSEILWDVEYGRLSSMKTKMKMTVGDDAQKMDFYMNFEMKLLPDKK